MSAREPEGPVPQASSGPVAAGRRWLPALLVGLAGLALAALAWWAGELSRRGEARAAFEADALARSHAVERELAAATHALESLKSLYASSQHVDETEFASFATPMLADVSSLSAVGWVSRPRGARADQREQFALRDSPAGAVGPAASGQAAWPLAALPDDAGEGRILLLREPAIDPQPGRLLLVAAVPDRASAGESPAVAGGHLLAELNLGPGLGAALAASPSDAPSPSLTLLLGDGPASSDRLALRPEDGAGTAHGGPTLRFERPLAFAPARWRLLASASRQAWMPPRHWQHGSLVGAVLAFAGALTALVASGSRRSARLEELARQREEVLRARSVDLRREVAERESAQTAREGTERLSRAVLESTADGVITVDARGAVVEINPAAERLFAWSSAELAGRPFIYLLAGDEARDYARRLEAYIRGAAPTVLGDAREVTARRSDGTEFEAELTITDFAIGGERFFVGVVRDIAERKRVERMKDEFLATVSHELRTPVTSILGGLRLLAGGAAGELSAEQASLVRIAVTNGGRLVHLLDDLLDAERMQSGKLSLEQRPHELGPLIAETVQSMQGHAAEREVELLAPAELPSSRVLIDRDRIGQVLLNLLSNAVKHSPRGGEVRITSSVTADRIELGVEDDGPGIPAGARARIFERFGRLDASDSQATGGVGLGLAIARELVERHGGRLDVTSGERGGSRFFFDLPLLTTAVTGPEAPLGRILVVEDDPDVAHLIQRLLLDGGYASEVAHSAEDALARLPGGDVQALTVDAGLPGASGLELVRELRAKPETRKLPVIFISGEGEERLRELNGHAIGVLDWLQKPIDPERLLAAVARARNEPDRVPVVLNVADEPE